MTMQAILWIIAAVLIVLWLIGLVAHLFAGFLWWLLVIGAVLFVISFFTGRSRVV
jgi:Family of unknown function (DUF5670)